MLDSMAIKRIIPQGAPGPRSDYSLVSIVDAGQTIAHLAGQTGRSSDGSMDPHPRAQAAAALENLKTLLATVNSSPEGIIHTRTYLVGRDVLGDFVAAREAAFSAWFEGRNPPTNTLAIVSGLADPDALVEIEAVAIISDESFDNPASKK